jgi:hypothetical protein
MRGRVWGNPAVYVCLHRVLLKEKGARLCHYGFSLELRLELGYNVTDHAIANQLSIHLSIRLRRYGGLAI